MALTTRDFNVLSKGQHGEAVQSKAAGTRARRRGERDLAEATASIDAVFRGRMCATKAVAAQLRSRAEALDAELTAVAAARRQLVKTLALMQRPLALTMRWNAAQAHPAVTAAARGPDGGGVPARGGSGADAAVDASLAEAGGSLRGGIGRVANLLAELDSAAEEARVTRADHAADMTRTAAALRHDRGLLNPDPDRSQRPADPAGAGAGATPAGASLTHGTVAAERCKAVRLRAAESVAALQSEGLLKRPAGVVDALGARIRRGESQQAVVATNAKVLAGELAALEKAAAAAEATASRVAEQITDTKARLRGAAAVPEPRGPGIARRTAAETLEQELLGLQKTAAALGQQLGDIAVKKTRVKALVAHLEAEGLAQAAALGVDRVCHSMALPSIAGAPGFASAGVPAAGAAARGPGTRVSRPPGAMLPAVSRPAAGAAAGASSSARKPAPPSFPRPTAAGAGESLTPRAKGVRLPAAAPAMPQQPVAYFHP